MADATLTDRDIIDHPLIGQRYFFPLEVPLPDAVEVPTPVGPLACWRSAPASSRPVLVHFHGNGELVHHYRDGFAALIDDLGWDLFCAEYRGYGASAGTPRLASMLDDSDAIAEAVGVPSRQLAVFGRSVGSIFAIDWLRRFPETAGVVLESGIHDVFERLRLRVTARDMWTTPDHYERAVRARFDHTAVLQAFAGPGLVLHAEQDHLVGIAHAEANAAALGPRGTFVRFDRGDHNSIFAANSAEYVQALRAFLQRLSV